MPILLTILVLLLLIYITRELKPMFNNHKNYKVSFNDLTTKDHLVKETNIQGSFGHLLEVLQEEGKISGLTILDSWVVQDLPQQEDKDNKTLVSTNQTG